MKKALADPAVAERFVAAGLVVNGSSPEAMTALVKSDVARFGALVKAIGIKPE
jgi:tripartite-type tricarboxylate transporter receptor subunit TctC